MLARYATSDRAGQALTASGLVDHEEFSLIDGFQARIISSLGEMMSDGIRVPELHDGMGSFLSDDGGYVLVRNHEISEIDRSLAPDMAYDPDCRGGTTTIHLDRHLNVLSQYLSLTGTVKNCSGGVMPWGSWLSCEEMFTHNDGIRHGYVFEVDHREPNRRPRPLTAMGRFEHEACAWDPRFGHVYMTEDRPDGNLYRFIPPEADRLSGGGLLQALAIKAQHTDDRHLCGWIDIENPDPEHDTVRHEAQEKGAPRFRRPEGLWLDRDGVYFSTTTGGRKGYGEIYRYTSIDADSGILERVYESGDRRLMRPDALVRAPWGDLLICEDSSNETTRIIGMTESKRLYVLAEGGRCGWTGIHFSPDHRVLFVNQQYKGRTLAITGDWSRLSS